jgi:hypothetical protein
MTYALGGLGVAGLGTFGALRFIGDSDFDKLERDCAPTCSESDVAALRQTYIASNVALGIGAGAAVGALLWYVLDSRPSAAAEAGAQVGFVPARRGAMAMARGRF